MPGSRHEPDATTPSGHEAHTWARRSERQARRHGHCRDGERGDQDARHPHGELWLVVT